MIILYIILFTDLQKNGTVTTVGTTSAAMAMLSKEKKKIDVMIFNVHSTNMLSFELLVQAVAFDIISLCKYLCYSSTYVVSYV